MPRTAIPLDSVKDKTNAAQTFFSGGNQRRLTPLQVPPVSNAAELQRRLFLPSVFNNQGLT
jgi:hypothetical protein